MEPFHERRFRRGPWEMSCLPRDGARISRLSYDGYDLLTPPPIGFRPPSVDVGAYEMRPVYGCDECFPTVDSCYFPETDWFIPDHGELCWLKWSLSERGDAIIASTRSRRLSLVFARALHFGEDSLEWRYEILNEGDRDVPFMHVMHPLLRLGEIDAMELPAFTEAFDEGDGQAAPLGDPGEVARYLADVPRGTAAMLLLRGIREGKTTLQFQNGLRLTVGFPAGMFPTLGIWWNNGGHPDEDGLQRTECAFEPIPGSSSCLADSHAERTCPFAPAGRPKTWSVTWSIETGTP